MIFGFGGAVLGTNCWFGHWNTQTKRQGSVVCLLSDAMDSWKLPSNSGWNMTSWLVRDVVQIRRKRYLLVEVILTGKYWNRIKLSQGDFTASDRARDYSVNLLQVLIDESALKKLNLELSRWLKTPIDKFTSVSLNVKEELAGINSQVFTMEFGNRDDLIINLGQTACTISYKMNVLAGQCSYVVDQSCIQTFVDGVTTSINAAQNKKGQRAFRTG